MSPTEAPGAGRADRQVLVMSADAGRGSGEVAWHTVRMAEWLRDTQGTRPVVVTWHPHPLADELARFESWSPHHVDEHPLLRRVRAAPGGARAAGRLRDVATRLWLSGHRSRPAYIDGAAGAAILPWLDRHAGPLVWHVHPGETVALTGSGEPGAAVLRHRPVGSTHILVSDDRAEAQLAAAGIPVAMVQRVGPHRPTRRSPRRADDLVRLGVVASPTDEDGADLLPRLLWHLDRVLDRTPVLRWNRLDGPDEAAATRFDLRRLGYQDRIEILSPPVDRQLFLESIDVVLSPGRHPLADQQLIGHAAAAGRPTVAFGAAPGLEEAVTQVPFPDLAAMAEATAALVADRRELDALADRLGADARNDRLSEQISAFLRPAGRPR